MPSSPLEYKSLSRFEIKDAGRGEIAAVFSTLGVIDKDGDVTLKGAFTDGAPVVISAYGHKSWEGKLPVGKGRIREVGNEAVMEGRFFMNTSHGVDTFNTVQALSEEGLQEWSYSLNGIKSRRGEHQGRQVRFIEQVAVKEVSPVLVGAGVNTRTLPGGRPSDDGKAFVDALTNEYLRSIASIHGITIGKATVPADVRHILERNERAMRRGR